MREYILLQVMQMIKTDLVPISQAKTQKKEDDNTLHCQGQLILAWKGKDGKQEERTIGFPLDFKLGMSDKGNDNFHFQHVGPRDVELDGVFYKVYLSGNMTVPNLFGHSAK